MPTTKQPAGMLAPNSPSAAPNGPNATTLATVESLRRLRLAVVTAANVNTDAFDVPAINSLFDEVAACMPVPKFVRGGFSGFTRSESLANIMVAAGNIDSLDRLAHENRHGVTLEDLCSWQRKPELDSGRGYLSLAETAMDYVSPEGLALALRLRPDDASITKLLEGDNSVAHRTLHCSSLQRAMNLSQVETARDYLTCARLLLEHGAPFQSSVSRRNPVASTLLSAGWRPELAESLSAMLRQYHSAGQFDLDEPLDLNIRTVGGQAPLVAAIKNGNAVAAKDLLALGCNYKALIYGTKVDDLLHFVRSCNLGNEAVMLSSITAGLMEREINEASAHCAPASPNTAPRRTMRAAL